MKETQYDLFLFAGQSNMAGRGVTSPRWPETAPALTSGAGLEYRAVSDPGNLYPIAEPFGAAENDPDGIFEPGMKTGSLVTAFVNAYYAGAGVPVIGVSASKGGSAIARCRAAGLEHCFLIAIGQYNGGKGFDYAAIHRAQLELAAERPDVTLVSDAFWSMRDRGLMKDDFHYYQQAYNEVGTAAGNVTAAFVKKD